MNISDFKNAGAGVLIVETVYTTAALAAEPPASDLKSLWEPADKSIRAAQHFVLAAADKAVMADAVAQSASFHAREAMSSLWMDARKEVGNAPQAPEMKKFFPHGLTGVKKLGPEALCEEVQRTLLALEEPGVAPALAAHAKPLREVVKQFEKPLAGVKTARLAEGHAAAKWVEARQAWIATRVALFGALTQRFPNRPGYVRSFFRPAAAVKKPAAKQDADRPATEKDAPKAAAA